MTSCGAPCQHYARAPGQKQRSSRVFRIADTEFEPAIFQQELTNCIFAVLDYVEENM